ncbi:MAG: glycosyltransferase family 39 protein [Cytophagales bacterium]|nr:glycosyltransferase family 39 protein [Cytophagales bacterium]
MIKRFFARHILWVAAIAIWVLFEIILNPTGYFPLNDDWSYTLPIYYMSMGKPFILVDWGAMTLIAQIAWGWIITTIFGFSFVYLRLSVAFVGIVGCVYLYKILMIYTHNKRWSTLGAAILLFNPFYFSLSNTFMTEVPFTVCFIISLYYFLRYVYTNQYLYLVVCTIFCVMAVMIRQIGIYFTLPYTLYLLIHYKKYKLWSIAPFTISFLAIKIFEYWLSTSGLHLTYYQPLSKAGMSPDWVINNYFSFIVRIGVTFYWIGLFCLPINIPLAISNIKTFDKSKIIYFLISFIPLALTCTRNFDEIPTWGIFYNYGIGSLTLPDLISLGVSCNARGGFGYLFATKCVCLAGSLILVFNISMYIAKHLRNMLPVEIVCMSSFILYSALFIVFDMFFDRYIVPIIPLFIILIILNIYKNEVKIPSYSIAILMVIAIWGLAACIDYHKWNRLRWQAIDYLENVLQIPVSDIHGGFEYVGWKYYDPARQNDWERYFWHPTQTYLITTQDIEGYNTIKKYPYTRLLTMQNDSICIIKKTKQ